MNKLLLLLILLALSNLSFAKGGGDFGVGLGISLVTTGQPDLDAHIARTNSTDSQSISKFGNALEFSPQFQYRFGGLYGILFRPSYFTQSTSAGTYKYSLNGFTAFPIFRIYPLENSVLRMFFQAGIGYGNLSGKIEQADNSLNFSSGSFGTLGGLGAEICFTDAHCMVLEGSVRYLSFQRNIVGSSTGTVSNFSQTTKDMELEYEQSDVGTSMSGIVAGVYYMMMF
jgi:hypothetical protein